MFIPIVFLIIALGIVAIIGAAMVRKEKKYTLSPKAALSRLAGYIKMYDWSLDKAINWFKDYMERGSEKYPERWTPQVVKSAIYAYKSKLSKDLAERLYEIVPEAELKNLEKEKPKPKSPLERRIETTRKYTEVLKGKLDKILKSYQQAEKQITNLKELYEGELLKDLEGIKKTYESLLKLRDDLTKEIKDLYKKLEELEKGLQKYELPPPPEEVEREAIIEKIIELYSEKFGWWDKLTLGRRKSFRRVAKELKGIVPDEKINDVAKHLRKYPDILARVLKTYGKKDEEIKSCIEDLKQYLEKEKEESILRRASKALEYIEYVTEASKKTIAGAGLEGK